MLQLAKSTKLKSIWRPLNRCFHICTQRTHQHPPKNSLHSWYTLATFYIAAWYSFFNQEVVIYLTLIMQGHSSRLAALDYTVCLHSEVFVTTQGGNFPHFLVGHRRYLYEGHARTIKPDKRKLALLFDSPKIR